MRRILHLIILCVLSTTIQAQHTFKGTSLSDALIELDQSSKRYDISFVYDELEDFTVTKTIKRGRSLPEAVHDVCGFYPVRVTVKGRDILVECIQKDRAKLRGHLVGPDRQPIAYANITLFPPSDSTYVGGGVSNEAGDFVIPCGAERTRVRISCVGFKTIEREMAVGDAGTIRMQMENNYLSDVTVSGRLSVIRSEAGRLQYIVSNDEFAKGHNAQELLNRVPMVSMAGGRAMILGKGPARFMLNGRITEMGDEVIQQKLWTMHSEDIDRIEVISIPSGRDMTEMGGGYINIVMRRDQTLGWRGDISAEGGLSDDWSGRGSGSVSYASEKFDMTIDAHGGRTTQTTGDVTKYHIKNFSYDVRSTTHTEQTDKDLAANLTFRYLPTDNLELGGMLSWQLQWPEEVTDGILSYPILSLWSKAELSPNDNTCTKSLTAYCDWHIDSKGKLLSFTYNNYKKDDNERSDVLYISKDSLKLKTWNRIQSDIDYHIQSGRFDLTLPYPYITIDAGVSYTTIKNQIQYMSHSTILNYNDNSFYQEKRKAAYISFHHAWDRISIKAGLRFEHTALNRETKNRQDDIIVTDMQRLFSRDYWLPSFSFSYKPWEGHEVSLIWGTNTIHPNFYDLNPHVIYKTGYEYIVGNPALRPSWMNNIELSYHNRKGLYACAYHHHAGNVVEWSTNINTKRASDIFYTTTSPGNNGRYNQAGLFLRYQRQLSPSLLTTAEGEAYYYDYKMTTYMPYCIQNVYGWGKRLTLSADWYLNRQHTLLLNGRYQHWFSDYYGMTENDGYAYFNIALRYSMMDGRLRLSLVVNDPFRQHVTDETHYSGWSVDQQWSQKSMIQYSHTNHHTQYIGITATYSLGGKKVRRIQHDMKNTESQRAEKR